MEFCTFFSLSKQVRDLTLKFVLSTNSAFRICENKELMQLIAYVWCDRALMPVTKTLMSDMERKYQKMKLLLIERIEKASYVCLTADGWSHNGRSFMGVTIHMFDGKLQRHSYLLAFRRMMGRHTFENIKEVLIQIIKEFRIQISKITHIVTDGASNFEKAFKIYGSNVDGSFIPIVEGRDEINVQCDDADNDDSEIETIIIN